MRGIHIFNRFDDGKNYKPLPVTANRKTDNPVMAEELGILTRKLREAGANFTQKLNTLLDELKQFKDEPIELKKVLTKQPQAYISNWNYINTDNRALIEDAIDEYLENIEGLADNKLHVVVEGGQIWGTYNPKQDR